MAHRIITMLVTMLALAAFAGGALAAEEDLKQLSDAGITITYPSGLEPQAQRVLEAVKGPLKASLDVHQQIITLLGDCDSLAREIVTLLAAEEKQIETKARLQAYKEKSEAMAQCFSNLRLIKKADAAGAKQIDAGVLQARYDEKNDEFEMGMSLGKVDEAMLKRSYFPVFVNADGTIKGENNLANKMESVLGSNKMMAIAAVHETVGYIIAQELRLYYPLSRWFNEGVSGWVTRNVVTKADPKLAETANLLLTVNAKSKQLKDKVNLAAWLQNAFQNPKFSDFDPALEVAQTQYSVEVITQLLGRTGPKDLPKIIGDLKYNANADTDTICETIKKVTGKDFKATLQGYVPEGVRKGDSKKLISQAEALANEKKWAESAAKLRLALQIVPADVNARINLAWLEREFGEKLDSEMQIFLVARLLQQENYKFHLYVGSVEGNYVCGRLAILMGNLESAKKFLEPVLALKPNHSDAKRAMDDIMTLEAAAKQTTK